MNWQRAMWLMCSVALVFSLGGCTEDSSGAGANNDWDVGDPGADADDDATPEPDTEQPDTEQPDAEPRDIGLETGPPPNPDVGLDVGPDVGPGGDTDIDPGDGTPFTAEGMASRPFYGVFRLTEDPAITGSAYKIDFHEDMTVAIGFYGEVTGKWEFFGSDRVRVYELEHDGQPNQPPAFPIDANLDGENIEALEMYIPEGPSGSPYLMRLEQLADTHGIADELVGDWQSEASYVDENDNPYHLAMRLRGGQLGYGIYNGAYVEFAGGTARWIPDNRARQAMWFIEPSPVGDPMSPLAGEVVWEGGEWVLYAPRHLNPGEEPAEFEAVKMHHVDAFRLDD
jgi:hypothetical protein